MEPIDKYEIEINKIRRHGLRFPDNAELVISRCCCAEDRKQKCIKHYNARAQPLYYSLNIFFGDIFVAVVVVIFLTYWSCATRPQ